MALLKRQEKILDTYIATIPSDHRHVLYDELPASIVGALEKVKSQETLWCDAERYISDALVKRLIARRGMF